MTGSAELDRAAWLAARVEVDSKLRHPPLRPSRTALERHFADPAASLRAEIPNAHHESDVPAATRRKARPAGVLIPIVDRADELTVLVTRRHRDISFAGHICFPGGRTDADDPSPEHTALREAHEEIGLAPERVRILGRLGDYYTHSGYRIAPVVGVTAPPLDLVAHPREVEEILEIPLPYLLRSDSYRLFRHPARMSSAHYSLTWQSATITGPTISLLLGFYEQLTGTLTRP